MDTHSLFSDDFVLWTSQPDAKIALVEPLKFKDLADNVRQEIRLNLQRQEDDDPRTERE